MPSDRLLETLLRSLQTHSEQQDTPRLLSTASSLLATLSNHRNVAVLTSQLLTAPAIWYLPDGLRTCLRAISVFQSATIAVIQRDREWRAPSLRSGQPVGSPKHGMRLEAWITAVIRGADERSPRWKHTMVLAGVLLALEQEGIGAIPKTRAQLQTAFVQAVNLALSEVEEGDELGGHCITLVLNYVVGSLPALERSQLDHCRLLSVLSASAFFSAEGFQSAYFLGAVEIDISQRTGNQLNWPAQSSSFNLVSQLSTRPLMSSMGPLSRLIAETAEQAGDIRAIQKLMLDLMSFSRSLLTQWRQNRLSSVDNAEESTMLDSESRERTCPVLWKVLQSAMFACTIVIRSVLGKVLANGRLAADTAAPIFASQTLYVLRHLYFISLRMGANSFSQYNFIYLAAIDILAQYPLQVDTFVKDLRPQSLGAISPHPLDRCLDLYFLNTAEHFTLVLSPSTNEELLIAAAVPYLSPSSIPTNHASLTSLFEAAHSITLAVFSAPQNSALASKHLPFYVDALFSAFPSLLSPRQFRFASKTLIAITSPPSPLSLLDPHLPSILLELIRHRAASSASTTPIPQLPSAITEALEHPPPPLSEQATLILTLLDALPSLAPDLLPEWLDLSAELLPLVPDGNMREHLRARFWQLLVSEEMDPERAQCCVGWWIGRGGRQKVLFGTGPIGREDASQVSTEGEALMSGALNPQEVAHDEAGGQSKL